MILEWSITLPADDNRMNFYTYSQLLTVYDHNQVPWHYPFIFSCPPALQYFLTFSVVSPPHSLPLFSSLLISPVINGTEVICRDRITLNSSHSATISIVNNSTGKLILTVSLSNSIDR
jgi:hypothetical protein